MFRTSDTQIAEIAEREGFRAKAYRPIPTANLTIGYGQEGWLFPNTPGAIEVTEGLTINKDMAWEALCYFVYNITDPLVRKHCNPQTQAEHDACASWVYNVQQSKLEAGGYTLPKLVSRKDRSSDALAEINDCWVQYCLTPGAESGLYRRRLVELLDFHDLPKTPAVLGHALSARVSRLDKGEPATNATYFHPAGRFAATVSPAFVLEVAESQKARTRGYTTDELNARERARLAGEPLPEFDLTLPPRAIPKPPPAKPKPVAKAEVPVPVPAPQVDVTAPPKPMESSKTHKGLSKKESGQEAVIIGTTVTGIGAVLPNVNALTAYLNQFPIQTILMTVAIIGICIALVGAWRWWAGRMIAHEGRLEATQTKV